MSNHVVFRKPICYDSHNTHASVLGSNPGYPECWHVGFSSVFPSQRRVSSYVELIRPVYVGTNLDEVGILSLRNVYVTNKDVKD